MLYAILLVERMKFIMRRPKTDGQIKKTEKKKFLLWERKLLDALRGIYYRHEFARRNPEVIQASEVVLKNLGIPPQRAERFLSDKTPYYFSLLLINTLNSAQGKDRQMKRKHLVDFLSRYGVFPMARGKTPFFPFGGQKQPGSPDLPFTMPLEERVAKVFAVWFALVKFEGYVMLKWHLGRPSMLPVMILRRGRFGNRAFTFMRVDEMREEAFPVLVDLYLPEKRLASYLTACRVHRDMFRLPGGKDELKDRAQWKRFVKLLQVLDKPSLRKNRVTERDQANTLKGRRRLFYAEVSDRVYTNGLKEHDTAKKHVKRSIDDADDLLENYRTIV